MTVVDDGGARLRLVQAADEQLGLAEQTLSEVSEDFGDTAREYRAYQWHRSAEDDGVEEDLDLETEGEKAFQTIGRAAAVRDERRKAYADAIARTVADGVVQVGDVIVSPYTREALIVAVVLRPEVYVEQSEAYLTADGLPGSHQWHSPVLKEGRPVADEIAEVRFERWGLTGMRVGGWLHEKSRGIVRVD